MNTKNSLREDLAWLAHDTWARWMKHLFTHSTQNADGSVTIPPDLVNRWLRQINTDYSNLTEKEKDSDRKEADRVLPILYRYQGPKR